MHPLELKIPPLILTLLCAFAMWAVALLAPGMRVALPGLNWLAAALATAGGLAALLGVLAFRHAGTTVDPRVPAQANTLVVRGIYRRSRNPMYLGFLLVLLAWGLYLGHLLSLLWLPGFVLYLNRFQIRPEERIMRQKFGTNYEKYTEQVRRWA